MVDSPLQVRILDGPGQFIPNIQRFVRGPEKLAKRLAVIAFEDADPTCTPEMPRTLVSMLAAALLSQNVPLWYPHETDVEQWFRAALALHASTAAMQFDPETPRPVFLRKTSDDRPFQVCAALLRNVRSFQGDMNMVDDIARHRGNKRVVSAEFASPMPFPDHCIDQHTHPNLVFLFPKHIIQFPNKAGSEGKGSSDRTTPFAHAMNRLFVEVTGRNPRRHVVCRSTNHGAYIGQSRSRESLPPAATSAATGHEGDASKAVCATTDALPHTAGPGGGVPGSGGGGADPDHTADTNALCDLLALANGPSEAAAGSAVAASLLDRVAAIECSMAFLSKDPRPAKQLKSAAKAFKKSGRGADADRCNAIFKAWRTCASTNVAASDSGNGSSGGSSSGSSGSSGSGSGVSGGSSGCPIEFEKLEFVQTVRRAQRMFLQLYQPSSSHSSSQGTGDTSGGGETKVEQVVSSSATATGHSGLGGLGNLDDCGLPSYPPLRIAETKHVSERLPIEFLAAMVGPLDMGKIAGINMIV
jgi:hypothetical protein